MNELGIYIHIPYCIKKCFYCDFLSNSLLNTTELDSYCKLILKELNAMPRHGSKVSSIFFGGGTPSLMSTKNVNSIMKTISDCYQILDDCEITMESNPETITKSKLDGYKNAGINRISMGVQSFDDKVLQNIGRVHDSKTALCAASIIKAVGFNSFNMDLMYGLPNQTSDSAMKSVNMAVSLGATHISAYELILESDTILHEMIDSGKTILPSEEETESMYFAIDEKLKSNGYKQYEVSNYALQGYKCKHNMNVWKGKEYISAGIGASSMLYDKTGRTVRYKNCDSPAYERAVSCGKWSAKAYETLEGKDQMFESLMLELRLVEGLDLHLFKERFGINALDFYGEAVKKNKKNGLLIADQNYIKLSKKGLRFQNQVLVDFIC